MGEHAVNVTDAETERQQIDKKDKALLGVLVATSKTNIGFYEYMKVNQSDDPVPQEIVEAIESEMIDACRVYVEAYDNFYGTAEVKEPAGDSNS